MWGPPLQLLDPEELGELREYIEHQLAVAPILLQPVAHSSLCFRDCVCPEFLHGLRGMQAGGGLQIDILCMREAYAGEGVTWVLVSCWC